MTYERPTRRGSRDELVTALEDLAVGWRHLGREDLGRSAAEAADRLASGAYSVRVGRTEFVVTEATEVS